MMNIEDLKSCGNCEHIQFFCKLKCTNKKSYRYEEEFIYADRSCDEWTWDKIKKEARQLSA